MLTPDDLATLKRRARTPLQRFALEVLNRYDGRLVTMASLADELVTGAEYARKLVAQLERAGLVRSTRTGRGSTIALVSQSANYKSGPSGVRSERTLRGPISPSQQIGLFGGQIITRADPQGSDQSGPCCPPGTQGSKVEKIPRAQEPGPTPTYGLGPQPAGDWARDGWKRERARRARRAEGPRDAGAGTDPVALSGLIPGILARIRERAAAVTRVA